MFGRRSARIAALMVLAGWATACATSVMNDDGSGLLFDGGLDASLDGTTLADAQPDSASPADRSTPNDTGSSHDSSLGTDSGTPQADSAPPPDASAFDVSVPDGFMVPEVLPDAAPPDGAVTCDISTLQNIAKYLAQCAVVSSFATPCSAGCISGFCCATICTDSNNNALCLLK